MKVLGHPLKPEAAEAFTGEAVGRDSPKMKTAFTSHASFRRQSREGTGLTSDQFTTGSLCWLDERSDINVQFVITCTTSQKAAGS